MSSREDRYSHSKRQYSRFDRDPRPKRSGCDVKPETVRQPSGSVMGKDYLDRDRKDCLWLKNASPLEVSLGKGDSKVETGAVSKQSKKKTGGHCEGTKHSSNQTKLPHSQSYFQHVGRGNAGQVERSFGRRASAERGWWGDAKEQLNDRIKNKKGESDAQLKDLNTKDNRKCSHTGQHDGYYKIEADPKVPALKSPAVSKQKFLADPKKTRKAAANPVILNPEDHAMESEKREERGLTFRHFGTREKAFVEKREGNRGKALRGNVSLREKYGASDKYGRTNRVIPRQGYPPTGGYVEKWKHDLYNEASRSPTPKNEDC
ncbi:unnamed protein product [Fraxinus pennsylvanica]|uniref:Uncharacterized protein n=1 Tax=Fraxinus pennsylvanica TaxID=56036 RepID=A0AAD2ADS2_9LAMI|nr:unnamed protein product [Fraxinus pennsylvanica]